MPAIAKEVARELLAADRARLAAGRLVAEARREGVAWDALAAAVNAELVAAVDGGEVSATQRATRASLRSLMQKADPATEPPSIRRRREGRIAGRRRSPHPGISLQQATLVLERAGYAPMSRPTLTKHAERLFGPVGGGRLIAVPEPHSKSGRTYRITDPELVAAHEAYEKEEAERRGAA